MILPQLEEKRHGATVVGMFFFEDNNYVLLKDNPIGARLHKIAKEQGILLMGCDQCCYEREIADKLYDGVPIGCFPDLYKALSGNMPGPGDHALIPESCCSQRSASRDLVFRAPG
jgi:hypothetical protein